MAVKPPRGSGMSSTATKYSSSASSDCGGGGAVSSATLSSVLAMSTSSRTWSEGASIGMAGGGGGGGGGGWGGGARDADAWGVGKKMKTRIAKRREAAREASKIVEGDAPRSTIKSLSISGANPPQRLILPKNP